MSNNLASRRAMGRSRRELGIRVSVRRHIVVIARSIVVALACAASIVPGASAQLDPNRRIAVGQIPFQVRPATLTVDKPTLQAGEVATFALSPPEIATDPALMWTITWSDLGSPVKQKGSAGFTRTFRAPGDYTVAMSAERAVDGDIFQPTPIRVNSVAVHVLPVPLDVEPEEPVAGAPVTLTVRFAGAPQQQHLTYRFVVDDDQSLSWSVDPSLRRVFPTPGAHRVYALIGTRGDPFTTTETKVIDVVPPPLEAVGLTPGTVTPEPGRQVDFKATLRGAPDGTSYRFHFGDGASSEWVTSPETSHVYQAAGTYEAFVEASSFGRVIRSDAVTLTVRAAFPISTILAVALVLAVATGVAWRWMLPTVRATPRMDLGDQHFETPGGSAISVLLHLRHDLESAETNVESSDGPLIKRSWRHDG